MQSRHSVIGISLFALMSFGICSCGKKPQESSLQTMDNTAVTTTVTTVATEPPLPQEHVVHMLAVGDNLVQKYVYRRAQECTADGTSYYFQPLYERVKPIIQSADVAIINQETLICGGEYEVSGSNYIFNSPTQLGECMVDLGFDVFTICNNHMLDKSVDGLESSLNYWDEMMAKYPILVVGGYRNEEDQNNIRVQEVNGIKIAYLAYTESLNEHSVPESSTIRIGRISDEELIERQIRQAKTIADAVIVSAHWGKEDTDEVQPNVKELAEKMIGWGADVILGTHPHTAQTMEYIEREDGSMGFVFYSLGNFISAQTDNFNMVGEMGGFDLVKDTESGKLSVLNIQCTPVITHYDTAMFGNLSLYPYAEYGAWLAERHGLPYAPMGTAKAFGMDVIQNIIEKNIPEPYRKLE
ncbi:MAG: CapA family protein [Oscillospiraceae bacterium]|nr:CapA family protein [Oscillospiraceae bacterium]